MNINTRDMSFVNFNGQEMQWIKFNGVIVYEPWKELIISGVPPLTLTKCGAKDLVDYKIYGYSKQNGTPTPETPVEVESVGEYDETTGKYKIPITARGTNIFDGLLQYGDYTGGTNRVSSVNDIPVKPNTTYRFSRNNERVYQYDENDVQIKRTDTGNNGNTITTEPNCKYIKCVWFSETDTTKIIWINEGTELLDYEPYQVPITTNIYLDEPLRKIGNYVDYIDFAKGKVVRRVEVVDNTGTLDINESLQGINAIEETIELPNIPTLKGTTILSIEDTLNSSYMEAVYKGKGKLGVLNEEDNAILNYILNTNTETQLNITNTEINEILDEIIGG